MRGYLSAAKKNLIFFFYFNLMNTINDQTRIQYESILNEVIEVLKYKSGE